MGRARNKQLERIRNFTLWSYAAIYLLTAKDTLVRQLIAVVLPLLLLIPSEASAQSQLPKTPVRAVIDNYFGTNVVDPYRWLENTSIPKSSPG